MTNDPRATQLVTSNRIEDYLPTTPQQAVDQAHGMILAGLIAEGGENTPALRIEAAEWLAKRAEQFVLTIKRVHGAAL